MHPPIRSETRYSPSMVVIGSRILERNRAKSDGEGVQIDGVVAGRAGGFGSRWYEVLDFGEEIARGVHVDAGNLLVCFLGPKNTHQIHGR